MPLFEDLIQNGLIYVGTIRSNKAKTSAKMKPNRNREVYNSMFRFKDKVYSSMFGFKNLGFLCASKKQVCHAIINNTS